MSKNFNNNTNVDSSLNLQVATLNSNLLTNYPTNTTISTLMASIISSQVADRTTAISAALASANLFTSNKLLNYMTTTLINSFLSSTITTQSNLRDAAISTALSSANAFTTSSLSSALLPYSTTLSISGQINNSLASYATIAALSAYTTTIGMNLLLSNYASNTSVTSMVNTSNLSQTSYINSKILTEVNDRNIAIGLNNISNLSLSKIYTATQSFSDVIIANKLTFSTIADGSLSYGYNATGTTQCINIGQNSSSTTMNSTCIGHNTKSLNGFNVCVGTYSNANAVNMISIGYNSGNQSNSNNMGCIFIGANNNVAYTTTYNNSVALGTNSQITANDQIQLGVSTSTVNCFNITPVNVPSTNINTINLTTTNITSSINNINVSIIKYTSLPVFSNQTYIGFSQSVNALKFYSAFNSVLNLCQITLLPGVYIIQYQISYNYSLNTIQSWHTFGIGTTTSVFDIQSIKSILSSNTSTPATVSNSYCYTMQTSGIVYLNTMISDFDNTNLTTSLLTNFAIAPKFSIYRIA